MFVPPAPVSVSPTVISRATVSPRAVSLLGALALISAAGCTCGDHAPGTPTDAMRAPAAPTPPRALAPLPVAPALELEPLAGVGEALTVVAARPQGPQEGEVRPTVTFSRPVKALEVAEAARVADSAQPIAAIEPPLSGEWRWVGSASVEFVPKERAPLSTEYRVTVFKGLAALDGSELKEDFAFSFSTPALALQDVAPVRGFRWLKADDGINALFSQPVRDDVLLQHARFVVEGERSPLRVVVKARVSIREERLKQIEQARAQGRFYEPMADDEQGFRNQQIRYTLLPERPFPLGRRVTLQLDPALHGEQGMLPMQAGDPSNWRTYGPFELTRARFCGEEGPCPFGPLVIETANELELASLKERLRIDPPVELDWDAARVHVPTDAWEIAASPSVTLAGKFRPGTQYAVSVAPGAQDTFQQTDAKGLRASLRTDDLSPALLAGPYLGFVEATGESPRLPIEVSNLKTLQVRLWKLSLTELVQAVRHPPWDETLPLGRPPDFTETEALAYPKNQGRVHPIQLAKVLGPGVTRGLVFVALNSPDLEHSPKQGFLQLAQVSDLAAHLKLGPKSSLAWVTRVSTGAPVPDADVSVYDEGGLQVWTGKTTVDGFADIPGAVALKLPSPRSSWEAPFALAVAQKDGDVSATANTWASGVEAYEFGLSQGWEGEAPASASFLFTDRGIYRPGDTVHVKGVVRYRSVGALRAPASGSTLAVRILDPKGTAVLQQNVAVNAYGTFALEFRSQKDGATGHYSVDARGDLDRGPLEIPSTTFRVEEYRPLQFRVDVESPKKDLVAGDELEATVSARYLYGGVMGNAPLKWSVHRTSTAFSAESARDFTFQQESWWWDDGRPAEASNFFASGEGRVDAQGVLRVRAGTPEAPGGKPYEYTLEAEVTDVNRQTVADRAAVTVHPASFYVGLRSKAAFLEVGTEALLDTVVVDAQGRRVAGRKLEVTVSSRTWKSVKKRSVGGTYETVSEPTETPVSRCALQSAEAPAPCRFKPATAGLFLVRATVTDDRGRQHQSSLGVYATGKDWVAWQRNDSDRVELIADKPRYEVGDVAKVLIKSPYPEARALLTVEREGVFERRLVDLKGSVVAVDVPVTEAMVPNIYVGVLIMRPRVAQGGVETGDDPGRPAARIGLVMLPVETKSKRLTVEVKTERTEYRPRDTVDVQVAVKDSAGQPADGEVTLYVVDEAVLRITSYVTPDPLEHIFPVRPLSMRLGEPLLHLVRRRSYGEKGEDRGGGGGRGEGEGLRNQFKTTVLFQSLETKGGAARASFQLPDNLTSFRVMAVVVTQSERFGSGEAALRVNKPVMALPALPRFARVGDTFEAGVVVHSALATAGDFTVSALVQGGVQLAQAAEQTVAIARGAPREIRFVFKANAPGPATFRFKVTRGADGDAVEEEIPVERPTDIEAVAVGGDTTEARVEALVPPLDVDESEGGLHVTLASTALGNFGAGIQQLIEYPYGCLEQQASRLVPFIALREIAGQYQVPWPAPDPTTRTVDARLTALFAALSLKPFDVSGEQSPDQVIEKTVRSIASLQVADGSFRYWPDASCSSPWASAYATLALARARDVGFFVSTDVLASAEMALARVVGGECGPCERTCDDETRAFSAYVLARMGKPRASAYGELYSRRGGLSLFGRALLANAMFVGRGSRPQAKALLQEVLNSAQESPRGVHFEEPNRKTGALTFQSDTRTTGAVLQALVDLQPDHPFVGKMAQYLLQVRRGDGQWRSTQEAAFSLMALTQVLRTKEKDVPDFKASLLLGAAPLVDEVFRGRSLDVKAKDLPMRELLAKVQGQGKAQTLTFKKEGAGVLYYSALLRYASKVMPSTSLERGLYVQRWFEPLEGGGQATKFAAGELVRLRVRVATNQQRHWAAIEVPLPAGLEVVDTSLATSARQTTAPSQETREARGESEGEGDEEGRAAGAEPLSPWASSFWSPFTHTELRDDRVLVFADHLPPGVHVLSFVARATTPGAYVLKPARGALMYEPEVFGRSEGGTFEVVVPETVSRR